MTAVLISLGQDAADCRLSYNLSLKISDALLFVFKSSLNFYGLRRDLHQPTLTYQRRPAAVPPSQILYSGIVIHMESPFQTITQVALQSYR